MANSVKKSWVKGRSRIIPAWIFFPFSVEREDLLNFAPWSGRDTGSTSRFGAPKPTRRMAVTYENEATASSRPCSGSQLEAAGDNGATGSVSPIEILRKTYQRTQICLDSVAF